MLMYERSELSSPARRRFLRQSTIAGAALSLSFPVAAAAVSGIAGEVYVNGKRVSRDVAIKPGDKILTGPDSSLTFMVGRDAFMLRQLTFVMMEASPDSVVISGLRILSGALVGVFGSGMKMITTGLVSAGIRGTGIYVETNPVLTYFCTCYGEVDLTSTADGSKKIVKTRTHASNYIYAKTMSGSAIVEAPLINHTNVELAALERLAGRQPVLPVK